MFRYSPVISWTLSIQRFVTTWTLELDIHPKCLDGSICQPAWSCQTSRWVYGWGLEVIKPANSNVSLILIRSPYLLAQDVHLHCGCGNAEPHIQQPISTEASMCLAE